MKSIIIASLATLLCVHSSDLFATAAHVDIGEALKRKIIRFEAEKVSTGLDLRVKNLLQDSVYLEIGAGWIFPTEDPGLQPQVVSRSHMMCMGVGEERKARLLTYCGNAPARGVSWGYTEFKNPVLGKPEMVATLKELEPYKLDNRGITQSIVWYYTNNFSMSSFHPGETGVEDYLTAIKVFQANEPEAMDPGYRVRYRESMEGDASYFSGISEEIEGQVKVKLNETTNCMIALLDENGQLLKPLKYINDQQPGEVALSFKSNVSDLPKGNYSVAVVDLNGKMLGELPVEI
jgi:hypothetical protein